MWRGPVASGVPAAAPPTPLGPAERIVRIASQPPSAAPAVTDAAIIRPPVKRLRADFQRFGPSRPLAPPPPPTSARYRATLALAPRRSTLTAAPAARHRLRKSISASRAAPDSAAPRNPKILEKSINPPDTDRRKQSNRPICPLFTIHCPLSLPCPPSTLHCYTGSTRPHRRKVAPNGCRNRH